MGMAVVSGATCVCTMGTAPGQITPTNQPNVRIGGKPAASIADAAPMANVGTCGMCTSLGNPAVAAATAAAWGADAPALCPGPSRRLDLSGEGPGGRKTDFDQRRNADLLLRREHFHYESRPGGRKSIKYRARNCVRNERRKVLLFAGSKKYG